MCVGGGGGGAGGGKRGCKSSVLWPQSLLRRCVKKQYAIITNDDFPSQITLFNAFIPIPIHFSPLNVYYFAQKTSAFSNDHGDHQSNGIAVG